MQLAHTTCAYSKRIPSDARRSRLGDVSASLQPNESSESALRSSAVMIRMLGFSAARVDRVGARRMIDAPSAIRVFIRFETFLGCFAVGSRALPARRFTFCRNLWHLEFDGL